MLAANKRKRVTKIPQKVKIEVTAKGWALLKFKFSKSAPVRFVISKYRRRGYLTKYELRKKFNKKINVFKINKIFTKDVRIYE